MYYYPENLKSEPLLLLWRLKDVIKIGATGLVALFAAIQTGSLFLLVIVLAVAFLCVRVDDTSAMEFLKYAVRYFITQKQMFTWGGEKNVNQVF